MARSRCNAGDVLRILTGLAGHVPSDIELMFHFCYGDANHKHAVEPVDMGDMVDMANRLATDIERPIQLIHMPVPRDRSDDAYFAPLSRLRVAPGMELSLGLVHYTDGLAGTRQRLATRAARARFLDRHRMRFRPTRSGDDPGIAAHPCASRRMTALASAGRLLKYTRFLDRANRSGHGADGAALNGDERFFLGVERSASGAPGATGWTRAGRRWR